MKLVFHRDKRSVQKMLEKCYFCECFLYFRLVDRGVRGVPAAPRDLLPGRRLPRPIPWPHRLRPQEPAPADRGYLSLHWGQARGDLPA